MIGTEGIPSLFTTLASSAKPVCAPDPLDPTTLPETELTQAGLQTVRVMLNAGWPVQNVVRGSWLGQDGTASNGTVARGWWMARRWQTRGGRGIAVGGEGGGRAEAGEQWWAREGGRRVEAGEQRWREIKRQIIVII
jgi:hypothetical protein